MFSKPPWTKKKGIKTTLAPSNLSHIPQYNPISNLPPSLHTAAHHARTNTQHIQQPTTVNIQESRTREGITPWPLSLSLSLSALPHHLGTHMGACTAYCHHSGYSPSSSSFLICLKEPIMTCHTAGQLSVSQCCCGHVLSSWPDGSLSPFTTYSIHYKLQY